MVAIASHSQIGVAAAMFYLAAYALMNIGAFAVITHFSRQGEKFLEVEDLAGLGWKQPVTAALFTIFLLSLIGVPLTGGFFGKFYIFKAALDAESDLALCAWLVEQRCRRILLSADHRRYVYARARRFDSYAATAERGHPGDVVGHSARHADPGHLPFPDSELRDQFEFAGEIITKLTTLVRSLTSTVIMFYYAEHICLHANALVNSSRLFY